jgi:hypothetical protein
MMATGLLDHLMFRRQFVLGPTPFVPTPRWSCRPLRHGLTLSSHPDLQVLSESLDDSSVALLGFVLDPLNPARTDSDIVRSLVKDASGIRELVSLTKPLAGRWVIIYQDTSGTYLFTDPFGSRSVFYYSGGRDFWCGSQPEIIKANCGLSWSTDEALQSFLMSPALSRTESAWVGAQTVYKGCLHLMPNHYLDVNRSEQIRFYPTEAISPMKTPSVIELAGSILRGFFAAVTRRYEVMMALTSGYDSRVMLAASRTQSPMIQYWMDRKGLLAEGHPDVWVPQVLARRLGIDLVVKNSTGDLPGWFSSALSVNVTGARILPKTRMIYAELLAGESRLNLGGYGSGICKNVYDSLCELEPEAVSTPFLARKLGYDGHPFVLREVEEWRAGLPSIAGRVNVLDLLYWEQRLGNWGAMYCAERDIAIDATSPYDCRLLIETLLSTPRESRARPNIPLYRLLARSLWPEVMSAPIQPRPKPMMALNTVRALKRRILHDIPAPIVRRLKDLATRPGPGTRNE